MDDSHSAPSSPKHANLQMTSSSPAFDGGGGGGGGVSPPHPPPYFHQLSTGSGNETVVRQRRNRQQPQVVGFGEYGGVVTINDDDHAAINGVPELGELLEG